MQRICFLLSVHPDRVEEYRAHHAEVPEQLRRDLAAAGWHNYSVFVTDAGQVIGYLETEDFARAMELMRDSSANAQWQELMRPLFAELTGGTADTSIAPVPEAFHLD
ncbi:MAG TPA: L-rhamnose mutarotase [Pseudonocardiaceae bacterium]